jgi:hypothetical protein
VLAGPPIGLGQTSGSRQTSFMLDPESELWLFTDGLLRTRGLHGLLGRECLRDLLVHRPAPADLLDGLAEAEGSCDLTMVRLQPPELDEVLEPSRAEALLVDPHCDADEIERFLEACGLEGEDLDEVGALVAAERRLDGQVLLQISRNGAVVHWRVERIEPLLGQALPAVASLQPS